MTAGTIEDARASSANIHSLSLSLSHNNNIIIIIIIIIIINSSLSGAYGYKHMVTNSKQEEEWGVP